MPVALAFAVGWWALGSHTLVPGWLARRPGSHRLWALAALPLALAAGLLELRAIGARPDALLAIMANGPGAIAQTPRLAAVLWLALLAADALLLAGWRRLEPGGWRLLAAFGGACLLAQSLVDELLVAVSGPPTPTAALLGAAACRVLIGLAAGALFLPHRPWLSLVAAAALGLHFLILPTSLRLATATHGQWATLLAAIVALTLAPMAPARLRRPSIVAGILLAALWLATVQTTADAFPTSQGPALQLPQP